MTAVLPHYKQGPANYQVSTLIYGGQLVEPTTQTAGTTDLTVKPAASGSTAVLGVAGVDANVIASQLGTPNAYGQPQIDISVLTDYTSVYYGGVDIWVWYAAAAKPGELLVVGTATGGAANTGAVAGASNAFNGGTAITAAFNNVVGRCTHPGGVAASALTQQIGGQGASAYFLGRARIF